MVISYRVKGNGINELFEENKHLVMFDDILVQMRQKIDYYLSHPDQRIEIARNGFELVNSRHTYKARLEELFKAIGIGLSEGF